jgi:beta-glucosidase/6-phospho-beta-glucosidase/beta-galactosidase
VINTCIEYGIEPAVTLYHWDLPLNLQNLYGGWLSSQIVDDFVNYARVIFSYYGNKVPRWFTVNEPVVFWYVFPFEVDYEAHVIKRRLPLARPLFHQYYHPEIPTAILVRPPRIAGS